MYEPQGPKRLTDIFTRDQTYIRFYGTSPKRFIKKWVHKNNSRPTVLRPGLGDRKKLFTIFFFQLYMPTDFWCHAREENNDQCPLHGNSNAEGHQAVQEQLPTTGTRNIVLLHDDASSHK